MNKEQLKYIITVLYIAIVLICILGILTADIYLFVASTILVVLTVPILLKNPDLITVSKKLKIGREIAYKKTFYLSNMILFYVSIAVITLRKNYPDYTVAGYALLLVIAMNIVIFAIIQKNIEKEYLR